MCESCLWRCNNWHLAVWHRRYPALTRVRGRDCFPSCPSRTFSHRLQSHCRGCPPLHLPPFWRLGRGSCLPLPASNTISGCQTFSLLLHSKTHLFQARKRRHKGPLCTWHVGPTNGPVDWGACLPVVLSSLSSLSLYLLSLFSLSLS